MDYKEKILVKLVEKYRNSKKDKQENKINRSTSVKPKELYKSYDSNFADIDEVLQFNAAASELSDMGYVDKELEPVGTRILSLKLKEQFLPDIEEYLNKHYGYVSKDMHIAKIQHIIDVYSSLSGICHAECEILKTYVSERKIPKSLNEDKLEDILKAVSFIENNTEALFIREASLKIYPHLGTKYFEDNTLQDACSLIRKYLNKPTTEDEKNDEILELYNIHKDPLKIRLRGPITLTISGVETDISGLSEGIEFSSNEIKDIDSIQIKSDRLITIENLTSFLRYRPKEVVTFYLGGYANRFQRDFLKKVYKDNPDIDYLHFGDIDAGGFLIHNDLCEVTGIPFGLFHMSVTELEDQMNREHTMPLSQNDRTRLQGLLNNELYRETVHYMLDHNIKLEQEIISLNLAP